MSVANNTAATQENKAGLDLASFWEKRLAARPDLSGVGHNGFGLAFNKWMYELRRRVFLRHVSSISSDFSKLEVLDVGSGTGFWLRTWQSLGVKDLIGSDITAISAHNICASIPDVKMLQLDITSPAATQILGRQFDAISAIDMLYHIMSDEGYAAAFSNFARSLKPGGHLVFTENLLHHQPTRAIVQANRSFDTIMNLLSRNGFTVLRRAPVFVLMNYPADTRSEIPKRLWHWFTLPASLFNPLGHVYGAALLPLDLLLTRVLKEGPSTEILICRKS